jgi:hypothetical protein
MELLTPPIDIARAGLRALKTLAFADGELHALERRLLESVQQYILKSEFDLDALPAITPAELAAAVTEPIYRERILSAAVITVLIDGEATPSEGALLEAYATAFGIASRAVTDVMRLIDNQLMAMRIDIARRSFMGQRGRAYLADEGIRGFVRILRGVFGVEDASLAERYRALEQMAPGTLGREYFEFIRRSHFNLPGEKNGPPEVILFHDCLHVLAGYETDSLEETQIASFQAGVLKKDSVFGLLFMLAQFHLGVQVTPVTAGEKLVADPALMLEAFVRGTKVTRDLCVDWRPAEDFGRTVDELRREYNIEPRPRQSTVTRQRSS